MSVCASAHRASKELVSVCPVFLAHAHPSCDEEGEGDDDEEGDEDDDEKGDEDDDEEEEDELEE